MKKQNLSIKNMLLIAVLLFVATSCADSQVVKDCVVGQPAGFWSGLWHGIISPISFIISFFDADVSIYAVNNSGGWYDFGFVLGIGSYFGGSTVSKKTYR